MSFIVKTSNIGGHVVRDNERYHLSDNNTLERLTLSRTQLYPAQATQGHKHDGVEEIYLFVRGKGRIQIDGDTFTVSEGDIAVIPDGAFHKVFNDSDTESLVFVSVFERYNR